MTNRRDFIKQLSAAGIISSLPGVSYAKESKPDQKIWAGLLHMSFNFAAGIRRFGGLRTEFEPEKEVWDEALKQMVQQGFNTVVINVEDHIVWESHPEIAVKNAWSVEKLRSELKRIRAMGLEPIPLLNFSTSHDAWLKQYERMVSSKKYREVCADLIKEVIEVFDHPKLFHLGMDEESAAHQSHFDYIVIRKNDLWWDDFYFLVDQVQAGGARAWVWSDYYWHHPEMFLKRMPKTVMQSNWYYQGDFDLGKMKEPVRTYVQTYIDLDKYGYDQIPTSSNDQGILTGIGNTVKFCAEHINNDKLKGFMQTFWKPTISEYHDLIMEGIKLMGDAKKYYYKRK